MFNKSHCSFCPLPMLVFAFFHRGRDVLLPQVSVKVNYCRCNKGLCRFCLHEEMESFYCRSCLDVFSQNEAATFKNKCSRFFTCPNCFNIMSMMVSPGTNKSSQMYIMSRNIDIVDITTIASFASMIRNKWISRVHS